MSKALAKPTATQAPADPPAQEAAGAATAVAAALVQPEAPAAPAAPEDARLGHGGLYTVTDGRRVLVQATQAATLAPKEHP